MSVQYLEASIQEKRLHVERSNRLLGIFFLALLLSLARETSNTPKSKQTFTKTQ